MQISHALLAVIATGMISACDDNGSSTPSPTPDTQPPAVSSSPTPQAGDEAVKKSTTTAPANRCSNTTPKLCSQEPFNPDFSDNPSTLPEVQHSFDAFSWDLFVALNWPAKADGTADTSFMIGENPGAHTVWQAYKESRDIFLPNGEKPSPWGQTTLPPAVCGDTEGKPVLTQVGKTPNVLDESGEPFQTGPLIDQNGQYARFAILTNDVMFDYIVNHSLYSKAGQKAFNNDADFTRAGDTTPGSIMVKSAWKVMGANDDQSKFHTTQAYVYNNPHENAGAKEACSMQTVGLVGLHFGTKTKGDPQWVWSTFEHVDNVPTQNQSEPHKSHYNFFNTACDNNCAEVNMPPPRPWNPATPHTQPSQIVRVIPIDEPTKALNKSYQDALTSAVPGSVWANYELISTQWPTDPNSATDPTGVPAPSFLANTTLESYIQGTVRQTSSSCIQCHNNAAMTNGKFADFTYLLQRAQ